MKLGSWPFQFKGNSFLGKIFRPYIYVTLTSEKIDELIPVEMIIDTGADYTFRFFIKK